MVKWTRSSYERLLAKAFKYWLRSSKRLLTKANYTTFTMFTFVDDDQWIQDDENVLKMITNATRACLEDDDILVRNSSDLWFTRDGLSAFAYHFGGIKSA
ncbi:hypothetical protein C1H46_014169 [Malus baccata]|uniref:Uncharacterized protein n=1 Tax=Malus baccata TaxID=106549 RepID=A0A540MN78_MALBA|nr:hypothetical protein C1H46_014169 [Malus baccata]